MRHVIILLANAYLEYRHVPRDRYLESAWQYVRTVDYSQITLL